MILSTSHSFLLGWDLNLIPLLHQSTRVDPMSLEELYAHLLTHEMRLEHNTATVEPLFSYANVASRSPSQKGKPKFKSNNATSGASQQHNSFHN
jgi:hypothetical protein